MNMIYTVYNYIYIYYIHIKYLSFMGMCQTNQDPRNQEYTSNLQYQIIAKGELLYPMIGQSQNPMSFPCQSSHTSNIPIISKYLLFKNRMIK